MAAQKATNEKTSIERKLAEKIAAEKAALKATNSQIIAEKMKSKKIQGNTVDNTHADAFSTPC